MPKYPKFSLAWRPLSINKVFDYLTSPLFLLGNTTSKQVVDDITQSGLEFHLNENDKNVIQKFIKYLIKKRLIIKRGSKYYIKKGSLVNNAMGV